MADRFTASGRVAHDAGKGFGIALQVDQGKLCGSFGVAASLIVNVVV